MIKDVPGPVAPAHRRARKNSNSRFVSSGTLVHTETAAR